MNGVLVIDIGGTNGRFAIFDITQPKKIKYHKDIWLKTNDASSLVDLCQQAENLDNDFSINNFSRAVIAVPGPIMHDDIAVKMVHVKWSIDIAEFKRQHPSVAVFFINDYIAQAYGCLTEAVDNALLIKKGALLPDPDIAIMGAGTGLGHGVIKSDSKGGYFPLQSEAGHATFPFLDEEEFNYREYLLNKTKKTHISYDTVVSGQGLSLLHEYLTDKWMTPSQVVANITYESLTTKWFSKFYGRSSRNFCLTVITNPGILYLTAGLAINNPFLVDNDIFRNEFMNFPSAKDFLKDIPIFLNINEKCGLWGAALFGAIQMKRNSTQA